MVSKIHSAITYSLSSCYETTAWLVEKAAETTLKVIAYVKNLFVSIGLYFVKHKENVNPALINNKFQNEKAHLEAILNAWVLEAPAEPDRKIAKQRCLEFCSNFSEIKLDLNNLKITALPEIFDLKIVKSKLNKLYLQDTQLTSLPESIGKLSNLTILWLRNTPLISLPKSIESLSNLGGLWLDNTQLTSVPESIGKLTNLTNLWLNNTQLTSVPECIGDLTNLRLLSLDNTPLTSVSESIGKLTNLQLLKLSNTPLTSVPGSISNLTNLQLLKLSNTQLTSVPEFILHLSSQLAIDLTGVNLSERIRTSLRDAVNAPGYSGPTFHFSMQAFNVNQDMPTTQESLKSIYDYAKLPQEELSKLLDGDDTFKKNLQMWLHRLQDTAGGKSQAGSRQGFYKTMIDYLRLANTNAEFKGTFVVAIAGTCETCGDRVALSILHLGIQKRLVEEQEKDIKALAKLLRGILALNTLEDAAREKVASLRFIDEIEVYLGYPIKLKEDLELPIDIDDMLYFRCSEITDKDLVAAKDLVLSTINNPDSLHDFLITQPQWLQALKSHYAEQYNKIEDKKSDDAEQDSADYASIEEVYRKALKELSIKALA